MGLLSTLTGIFSPETAATEAVEHVLDGTNIRGGYVVEVSPGQYEVIGTNHFDYDVKLLPENEISVMDLIDWHQEGR